MLYNFTDESQDCFTSTGYLGPMSERITLYPKGENSMQIHNVVGSDTFRSMFDALPTPIIVVDSDVMVQDYNRAAEAFLLECKLVGFTSQGRSGQDSIQPDEIPAGYLRSLFFRNHYIRYSVQEAFQGSAVVRRCTKLDINRDGIRGALDTVVTCSPFQNGEKALMLLIIEENANKSEMQGLIRICAACHKVIDENETLTRIEAYAQTSMGVRFSHGFCAQCFKKELAKIDAYTQANSPDDHLIPETVNVSRAS
jgi:hypothetical protein